MNNFFELSTNCPRQNGSGRGGLRFSSSNSLTEQDNTSYGFELPEFLEEEGSFSSIACAPSITWPLPAALKFMVDASHLATLRAAEPKNLTWPVMEEELPDPTSTPSPQPLTKQSPPHPTSPSKSSYPSPSSTPRSLPKQSSPHPPSPSKSSHQSPSSTPRSLPKQSPSHPPS
ncbi:uncharacterized protein [Watersipora subatra]|uniref:uncharacterized protein n=1 Tax=Watersipora subatra TaxID=2589382 RepID=UPI00355C0EE1